MTVFNIVAGICGILAFLVLCWQGVRGLKKETHRFLTRDSGRSLAMAQRSCSEVRGVSVTVLNGAAPGVKVVGPAYKLRALKRKGEAEQWLSPNPMPWVEFSFGGGGSVKRLPDSDVTGD